VFFSIEKTYDADIEEYHPQNDQSICSDYRKREQPGDPPHENEGESRGGAETPEEPPADPLIGVLVYIVLIRKDDYLEDMGKAQDKG